MQESDENKPQTHSPFKGFLPFFWLALACILGIIIANAFSVPTWVWAATSLLCCLLWLLAQLLPKSLTFTYLIKQWTGSNRRLPAVILAVAFCLGGWRYAATRIEITPANTAYYNDQETVQLIGFISQPPDERDSKINLVVSVESLRSMNEVEGTIISEVDEGRVLVQVQPGTSWHYGDRVVAIGQLQTPFESGDFSYADYLAHKGILSVMPYAHVEKVGEDQGNPIKSIIYNLRERGQQTLQELYPSPESDLLAGILLGLDQGLSENLQTAFRRTGTTHIIAISGFNIALLSGLITSIFTHLLGRKWGALSSICVISIYTLLVGADAAVVRAAIMGALGAFGGMFGRQQNGLNSLGLASLAMVLITPDLPWDISFQLSAAATLGLILYALPLAERINQFLMRWMSEEQANKVISPISEFFLFTLAAQVMTLPIAVYHFGGISWIALLANPLILPVQSLVMILGGLSILTGLLLPGIGRIFALGALPFVRYTIRVVCWLTSLPGGDWVLPDFNPLWLLVFYTALFLLTLTTKEQRKHISTRILSPQVGLLVLFGLVMFIWNRVLTLPDGNLHLTLIDAEGTILIQSPNGNVCLIGAGPSPSQLAQTLGQSLQPGHRRIDVLIAGSTARDDLNALTGTINAVPIEMALWGGDAEANQTTRTVYTMLLEAEVPIFPLETGQSIVLDEGIELQILWVGDKGAVLWLAWHNFSALLPTGKVEEAWIVVPSAPDVILLPDDLQPDELPLQRINWWSPTVILIPLEEADLPLHGEHLLLQKLKGYPFITTLEYDQVHISTDGEKLWVDGEKVLR
ncbi:MAG: ComEC/Rec2 family competence protein [Anaerolineales bacterium]